MADLERVTLAIDSELLARFDRLLETRGLGNRSEAVRDLIRARLVEEEASTGHGEAVASLTLLYDHEQRELSDKLTEAGHHHSGAKVIASMHVHLDDRLCLEVLALRGRPARLRQFADGLLGLKGVLHGQLVVSSPGVASPGRRKAGEAHDRRHLPSHPHPHPHAHPHLHPNEAPPKPRRKEKP